MIDTERLKSILSFPAFTTLTSKDVWDNAQGNATTDKDKSSIWVLGKGEAEAETENHIHAKRICNISAVGGNIDGVDRFSANRQFVLEAIDELKQCSTGKLVIFTTRAARLQLAKAELIDMLVDDEPWMLWGIACVIAPFLTDNEEAVS